jgi:hypothetical protein
LLPDEGEGGGWSCAGDDVLRVLDDGVDLWRFESRQAVREMRQNKGRRLGEGGGLGLTGSARFGRKRLQMGGAPVTNSVVLGVSQAERRKGGWMGRPGGFIGSRCLAEGVRVRAQGEIGRRAGEGLCPGVGDDPDEWAQMSAGEEEGEGPIRC